jgi:DNA repair protein RecN (Recombination protein N)
MLRRLAIRNFVLFESIEVEFHAGLNVISGETGGGKSNLAQALGLLRGVRARRELVRKGCECAEVAATFDTAAGRTSLERVVPASGAGRVAIDGRAASIAELRSLGERLLSVTSQHQQFSLTDPSEHRRILDVHGGLEDRLSAYREAWARCVELGSALEKLRAAQADREYRQQFLSHQTKEIRAVDPASGEDVALESDIRLLRNAERIRVALSSALQVLEEDEDSVSVRIARASRDLERVRPVVEELGDPLRSLSEAAALVEDASRSLSSLLERADSDPASLEAKQERAFALDRLKKKHGGTLEAVLERLAAMQSELDSLESLEERIADATRERDAAMGRSRDLAAALTKARRRASSGLERAIGTELARLAFGEVEFGVEVAPRPDGSLDESGGDDVRFLFRPNVGEELAPLDAIASGGELSRVFLAIRSVLGRGDADETLVFDEVDTGIGGKTADALGLMLRDIGRTQQVICITHLPQIAAHADRHVLVEKSVHDGRTRSTARVLDRGARRDEIARMLGGETITKRSRDAATEMIRLARDKVEDAP